MSVLKVGILGAGRIANTMARTLVGLEEAELYAVAARDLDRAQAFAEQYGAAKAYGSYEEMLKDPEVELVYVATPHSHHLPHVKLCIEHGKPVLCEKAFTLNAAEAKELIELSHEKGVFLAEAMWTRYMPLSFTLKDMLERSEGGIGEIVSLTCNLGYSIMFKERLLLPELGGGALLDLGVYTLNFATWVLGDDPVGIDVTEIKHTTGVDKTAFINLIYENGAVASMHQTMAAETDRRGMIYGTEGFIEVENINAFQSIKRYNNARELVETVEIPPCNTGFEYEVLACKRALEAGALECPEMPHAHSLRIMELVDEIRSKA